MSEARVNVIMLCAGLVLLFAGLTGWAGWPVAATVTGAVLAVISIANSYFVTWLSVKANK